MTARQLIKLIRETQGRSDPLAHGRLAAALWNCNRREFVKGVGGRGGQDIATQVHNAATMAIALWERPAARVRWLTIAITLIEHLEEAADEPLVAATNSIFLRGISQCQTRH